MITECNHKPLVETKHLQQWFPVLGGIFRRPVGYVKAVEDVSISIAKGDILGLVGESGSGKTTLGRSILRLIEPTDGKVHFDGSDITAIPKSKMRVLRRRMQLIFQDPYSSLNPHMTVGEIIDEALRVHHLASDQKARVDKIKALLELVGLRSYHINRYPHEFSGGQRQRIGIARAIAVEPDFIVADEPVSALDVSIQAQIINLLQDLQERLNLTILFIAHDLAVVRHISTHVAVMYLGRIVEIADRKEIYQNPLHPYTKALLSAVPEPDPELQKKRIRLTGDIPSPLNPPSGCVFRTRCQNALATCGKVIPELKEILPKHFTACIRNDQSFDTPVSLII